MSIQPISRRVYLVYVWNGKVFFFKLRIPVIIYLPGSFT